MKVTKLRPFIPSGEDYKRAQRFFEDIGFESIYSDDGLSIYRTGDKEFFLQNFHNKQFQENYMVELVVEDLDGWWEHIQTVIVEKNYPVKANEPAMRPWGTREIILIDLAGVCWHISEAKK